MTLYSDLLREDILKRLVTREVHGYHTVQSGCTYNFRGELRVLTLDDATDYINSSIKVPDGFYRLIECYVPVMPLAAFVGQDLDIFSTYGKQGEPFNQHSESDVASTYTFTANVWDKLLLNGILTNLEAGDIVGIRLLSNTAIDIDTLYEPPIILRYVMRT